MASRKYGYVLTEIAEADIGASDFSRMKSLENKTF
jgi:hypothetical protein